MLFQCSRRIRNVQTDLLTTIIFIFLKMLLGSPKNFSEKWEISKKNLGNFQNFSFFDLTFFGKTFFQNPTPVFRAGRFYVDCRASQHSRRPRSPLPKSCRSFFSEKSSKSRIFWDFCAAMFRRVPSCSAILYFLL